MAFWGTFHQPCGGSIWQDAACKSPFSARPHNFVGQQYSQKGRLDLAEREWAIAIQVAQADPHPLAPEQEIIARTNLAYIMTQQGRWREAYYSIVQILKAAPKYSPAGVILAFIYVAGGNPQMALATTQIILKHDDRMWFSPELYYTQGLAFHAMKQCDLANANYQRARDLNPKLQIEPCKG